MSLHTALTVCWLLSLLLSVPALAQEDAWTLYAQGNSLAEAGEYRAALARYREVYALAREPSLRQANCYGMALTAQAIVEQDPGRRELACEAVGWFDCFLTGAQPPQGEPERRARSGREVVDRYCTQPTPPARADTEPEPADPDPSSDTAPGAVEPEPEAPATPAPTQRGGHWPWAAGWAAASLPGAAAVYLAFRVQAPNVDRMGDAAGVRRTRATYGAGVSLMIVGGALGSVGLWHFVRERRASGADLAVGVGARGLWLKGQW